MNIYGSSMTVKKVNKKKRAGFLQGVRPSVLTGTAGFPLHPLFIHGSSMVHPWFVHGLSWGEDIIPVRLRWHLLQ